MTIDQLPPPSPLYSLPGSAFFILTGQQGQGKSHQEMQLLMAKTPAGDFALAPIVILLAESSGEGTMGELIADESLCLVWPVTSCDDALQATRTLFPEGTEPGMRFEGLPPGAATSGMPDDAIYTVTEVYPEHVVLDGNHPLAGIALRLRVKVLDVREATDEEARSGSVGEELVSVVGTPAAGDTVH